MQNIIIATHEEEEYINFETISNKVSNSISLNINTDKIELTDNGKRLIIYLNSLKNDSFTIADDINKYDGAKIILFHQVPLPISVFPFDVSSVANDSMDRDMYMKLFTANDKWSLFDTVWNYFSKKVERFQLKKSQEVYFNECIAESQWKELPEPFATHIIIEKWNELKAKSFDSQSADYDAFYKLVEDTWHE